MEKLYSLFLFLQIKLLLVLAFRTTVLKKIYIRYFLIARSNKFPSRAYFLENFPDLTIELFISVDNIPIFSGLLFYLFGENTRVSISRLLFPQVLSL